MRRFEHSTDNASASGSNISGAFSVDSSNASTDVFRVSVCTRDSLIKNRVHLPSSVASNRSSQVYEELNNLKFNNLGLYGRDAELLHLQKAVEAFKCTDEPQQFPDSGRPLNLVLVSGPS